MATPLLLAETLPAPAPVTIEEYLQSCHEPDVEYIDGQLKARPVVFTPHSLIQTIIGAWFFNHEEEWMVRAGVETRMRVSSTRVRLPDVVVDRAYKWPTVLTKPPLIVIEVLSPNDTYAETQRPAKDYETMGVANIWLIDPETRTGRICKGAIWQEVRRFDLPDRPIFLELDWLFGRLDKYDAE